MSWKGPILAALLVLTAVALLAACGGDDEAEAPEMPAAAEDTAGEATSEKGGPAGGEKAGGSAAGPGTAVEVADSQFGSVLFDEDERAIYFFDKEATERSECYGACAEAWPPVLTEGEPEAGGGAEAGLLGTTERRDGTTQVTYNSRPLYYYVDDAPGEVGCHNVEEFGGLWLAVDPSGDAIS